MGNLNDRIVKLAMVIRQAEEYSVKKLILITNDPFPRQMGPVLVLPWQAFLKSLWEGEIIAQ